MKVLGVIFARMDSQRLPGKPLMTLGDFNLIEFVYLRAKEIEKIDDIVLATTNRSIDDSLVTFAKSINLKFYRGKTNDLASRLIDCGDKYNASHILRINCDSPFIDKKLVNDSIEKIEDNVDLITNIYRRTFPYGISTEIIFLEKYVDIYSNFNNDEKEHVKNSINLN